MNGVPSTATAYSKPAIELTSAKLPATRQTKTLRRADVEGVFRSDARICAFQNPGDGFCPMANGTLGNKIVTFHSSFHVAIILFVRSSTASCGVSTFSDLGGTMISAAWDRPGPRVICFFDLNNPQLLGGPLHVSFD